MSKLTLVPAYGREYESQQEVQAAWESGQDFLVSDPTSPWDGSYVNSEDVLSSKMASVHIRYRRGIVAMRVADDIGGWDTGFVDTENGVWETGEVVSREEDGGEEIEVGDGSQVPPPRDDYGTEIDMEGNPLNSIKRVGADESWEGLARRVQKAHSKKAGAWSSEPLGSDDAYDVMDDLQNKADRGSDAVDILRYYLDKESDLAYGALGAWDFLITKGPADWKKDLAKLQGKIRSTAQSILEDTAWMSRWNHPLEVEGWLKTYAKGKPTGKLKYNFKIERWAIVGVETKHDAGKAWIQVNTGEIHTGRSDDMIISVSIDPGTGRLDVKS